MKKNTLLILLALPILFLGGCNRDDGDTIINKDGDTIINNTVAKSLPLNTKVSFGQHSAPNYQCTHLISPNNNFIGYVSQQGSPAGGAHQLYTATAGAIENPTSYLIGGDTTAGRSIGLFRISYDGQWIVWLDDADTAIAAGLWHLKSQQLNPDTGEPIGNPITLRTATDVGGTFGVVDFRISQDSQWVAYRGDLTTDGVNELYMIGINGTAATVTKVHPALIAGREVAEDYNFTFDCTRLIFRADGQNDVGEFGLYSYELATTATAWASTVIVAPTDGVGGDTPRVRDFRISLNSDWVVFASNLRDPVAANNHDELYSDSVVSDAVAPIQISPNITNAAANSGVLLYEISSDCSYVAFTASEPANDQRSLYSAVIDVVGTTWAAQTIQTATAVGQEVTVGAVAGNLPPVYLPFRITPDGGTVVFVGDLDNANGTIGIWSDSIVPGDTPPIQIAPTAIDATAGAPFPNGVRDFQVGDTYVVFICDMVREQVFECLRAEVNVNPALTAATFRAANLLHQPLDNTTENRDVLTMILSPTEEYVSFVGNLESEAHHNTYYSDITTVPAVAQQISEVGINGSTLPAQPIVDAGPRGVETYIFANGITNGNYQHYQWDERSTPPGGGSHVFGTYCINQENNGDGFYYLYMGYGPDAASAPLLGHWLIKLLALMMFMGIAAFGARKFQRASV